MTSFYDALEQALSVCELHEKDQVTVKLARTYALRIDEGKLPQYGHKLLATLTALGMTPASRKQVMKGGNSNESALEAFRNRRQNRTTPVDSSSS